MKIKKQVFLIVAGMFVVGTTVFIMRPFQSSNTQSKVAVATSIPIPGPGIEVFQGYKKWRRVNERVMSLAPMNSMQCVDPRVMVLMDIKSPQHNNKYYSVYVNPVGEKAMMRTKKPVFPVGSVIVKEKLTSKGSSSPELLTIMVKRELGYNKANGDWEYLVLNGTLTKVDARGKLENCQSCHAGKKDTDYVFRDYLPPSPFSMDLG